MSGKQVNPYLRTKILTASQEELRLMLYEGAIRFIKQGREGLAKKDYETSFNGLMRAQRIVLELSTSLNHEIAPDLCERLGALYTYIYRLLVDANVTHEVAKCDEALKLLAYEKETWEMLMTKLAQERGQSKPAVGSAGQGQGPAGYIGGDQGTRQSGSLSASG